jgi:hypothetical protein
MISQIEAVVKPYAFAPDVLKESPEARESVRSKLATLEATLRGYAL